MHDWNVVVTVHDGYFRQAFELLEGFGQVEKTDYFNVLVLKVADIGHFPDAYRETQVAVPALGRAVSRIMPVTNGFDFQRPAEFEAQAARAVEPWLLRLAGASFHVRMHRRGFRGRLSSQDEERFLDDYVLGRLREQGATARIDFDDPAYIIAVETVGQRAGLALWGREQRARYPFLKLD